MSTPSSTQAHDPVPADVVIDDDLVTALLREQHPDLLALPRRRLDRGWDHVMVRVGEELLLRLPRRSLGAGMIAGEQRFLADVGADLPLPVPIPLRTGEPTGIYPYRWSVVPWIDGDVAATDPSMDHAAIARQLGRFMAALHRPAPPDAPHNPYRGVPLASRRPQVVDRLQRLAARRHDAPGLDPGLLGDIIDAAIATPPWSAPPVWVHGDLHPGNLLISDGVLSGVLDFSDVHGGDPAVDAIVAWMLLPRVHHSTLRHIAHAMDDRTWMRGLGWTVHLALVLLLHGLDGGDAWYAAVGHRALLAVQSDAAGA